MVHFLIFLRIYNLKQTNKTKHACVCAKSLQSCPTLCSPIDGSPPGSPFPGILQARTLEWVAIAFSAWKWKWSLSVVSDSSQPHGLQPTRLLCPWDFPGKSAREPLFVWQLVKSSIRTHWRDHAPKQWTSDVFFLQCLQAISVSVLLFSNKFRITSRFFASWEGWQTHT